MSISDRQTIRCARPEDLDGGAWARWRELASRPGSHESPFFDPRFTQIVGRVCGDVEIAIVEEADRPAAFIPFHRLPGDIARPVGLRIADIQVAVVAPRLEWDPAALLRGCGLRVLRFERFLADDSRRDHRYAVSELPCVDVPANFEEYQLDRRQKQSRALAQALRKPCASGASSNAK